MNADTLRDNMDDIADDARTLISATADAADEKVVEARDRLDTALDAAQETYAKVQKKAVEGVRAFDQAVQDNPYQALGLAFGAGVVIGFLLSRRN